MSENENEIDFTKWTDAQLDIAAGFGPNVPHAAEVAAERARRAGTDDGSRARVAAFEAQLYRPRRVRKPRRTV